LLNEENNSLLLTAGAGERGRQMVSERRSISMRQEKSIVARAARLKQGVISNDVRLELTFLPHPLLPDTRAEMAVPIVLGERVLGVLDVQSDQVNAFTEQDVQTQTTLSAQVAVALQNSRLFVESEKTREELNALTRRLTREGWQEYLDTATEEMAFAYGSTDDEDEAAATAVAPLEKSLTIQGEPIGQLALADPQLMSDEADGIMAAVAERLSIHIENLRLTERSQTALSQSEEQARRLAALNEFSQTLNATTTMQEVFDVAVSGITGILPINRTSLTILDRRGDAFEIVAYSGEQSGMPAGQLLPVEGSPMGMAIQENRIVTGTTDDKIQSALFAPLVVGSRAVGTVNIGRLTANAFTGNDETLLAQIASLIGTRLENLRLLSDAQSRAERERQVRTITDRIRRAGDKDMILQVAQEEIGKMLGAKETAVKLGTQQQLMTTLKREKQNGA
jgi:GAF domain-containing protein